MKQQLTQEEKRIRLAEALGWRCQKHVPDEDKHTALMCWIPPGGEEWHPCEPPDYFNDLNACHEAEKLMTYEQHCHYADLLNFSIIPGPAANKSTFATAAQRAEALGQILNLWEAGE